VLGNAAALPPVPIDDVLSVRAIVVEPARVGGVVRPPHHDGLVCPHARQEVEGALRAAPRAIVLRVHERQGPRR